MMKEFRMLEFSGMLRKDNKTRSNGYPDVMIDSGDLVFYQYEDKKAWLGPEKSVCVYFHSIAHGTIRTFIARE